MRQTFYSLIIFLFTFASTPTYSAEVCSLVSGAVVLAQDDENTYLGKIASSYDSKSIFNEYGEFGSEYSSKSIWNNYGTFGSEYSTYSPHNKYSSTPPIIVKDGKILGYLSANKSLGGSISPNLLKELCKDSL